jgi:hypothetical protein
MNAERMGIASDDARCVIATALLAAEGPAVPGSTVPSRGPRIGLRSAAGGAAIELDNIFLKRKFKTAAIHQFIELLSLDIPAVEQSSSPMSLLTPTVIVMDRVVRSKNPNARLKDVIEDLESIVAALKRVADQPEEIQRTDPGLIEKLRTDCLDISRFAASLRRLTTTSPKTKPGT